MSFFAAGRLFHPNTSKKGNVCKPAQEKVTYPLLQRQIWTNAKSESPDVSESNGKQPSASDDLKRIMQREHLKQQLPQLHS